MLPEGIAMQSVERIRMKSARSAGRPPRQTGVTFIELMAVVLIIAILGMIGIPSYRDYTIRAHRTEAKTALLRLATNQERFYIQNHRYSDTIDGSVGFALPKSENGVYAITVELLGADWTQGYKATATPVPGGGTNGVDQSVDAKCTSFSLTSAGDKTAQGTQPETCWESWLPLSRQALPPRGARTRPESSRLSRIRSPAPTVIAESATLNAGKYHSS